jgi:peptidoglycan/xylan/chitin deacetylase (PgdA/CDA1 family)
MDNARTELKRAALSTLNTMGKLKLLTTHTRGIGAILMLHQVSPDPIKPFDPNHILRITPGFLERVIRICHEEGYEPVSISEAHRRLQNGVSGRPFVVFTLDDGYRDNLVHAYPVFKQHSIPFCVYVPSAYAEQRAFLWWIALEGAVKRSDSIEVSIDGTVHCLDCASAPGKRRAFDTIYWKMRKADEDHARAVAREMCRVSGFDHDQRMRELLMSWSEVKELASDPLCTIGAHTDNHYALAKLTRDRARQEIAEGRRRLEKELDREILHLSYPYGAQIDAGLREYQIAADLGFTTSVTTRKGLIYREHEDHLHNLPRVPINGNYQDDRMVRALLNGIPLLLSNGLRRVDIN